MKFSQVFEQGIGADVFIRLADGQSIEGVLRGDPYEFWQHWVNKIPSECKGKGCQLCAEGSKAIFRFRINMIVKGEDGNLIAKIFEQGKTIYQLLQDLSVSGYDLEVTKIKIARKGSTMSDTTYNVLPVPNGVLNEYQLKAVQAVKLNDLKPQEKTNEQTKDFDIPF